jgi:hypothetical protein
LLPIVGAKVKSATASAVGVALAAAARHRSAASILAAIAAGTPLEQAVVHSNAAYFQKYCALNKDVQHQTA